MSKLKDFFLHKLPGIVTTTGAGVVLGNAAMSYLSGSMTSQEAIYQAGMGIIGIGVRRAIGRLAPTKPAAVKGQ